MRQIILSIIGGFVLPIGYSLIAVAITLLLPQYNLAGYEVPGLLFVPVFFAVNIHEAVRKQVTLPPVFNSDLFQFTMVLISAATLYTGLSYLILTAISLSRSKPKKEELPPSPPLFTDEEQSDKIQPYAGAQFGSHLVAP